KSRSSKDEDLLYECRGDIKMGELCELGSQLRPHVVWFHEAVPMMEPAAAVSGEAAIFVVIGTSLQVYPAAGLINYAPYSSMKYLVDPNVDSMPRIKNLEVIQAKATEGVPVLVEKLIAVSKY
ncbi:MAG: NAD-dependent deacylase, partial [Chitinophagales bacterium]|nr:NAD-dependent deacylase [Chitinophagales bacterium]